MTHSSATPGTARGTASVILGICSLLAGWTFFILPLIGLILAASSRRNEPAALGRSGWGIALNLIAMVGWILATVALVVFAGFTLPWTD